MKKILFVLSAAAVAISMTACASAEKMAKMADEVTVQCTPSPLVLKGGKVEADLSVNCPKNYFLPKAIAEITPVIVYEGGESAMAPFMFQGEKVKDNYRVVAKAGETVNGHVAFLYKEEMAKSHLELRGRASVDGGLTWTELPTKKVAEGCFATESLAGCGFYGPKDDGYQEIITFNPEGQVMYLVNSSDVRSKEYKSASIKDFLAAIEEAKANDRKEIKSIDIISYASPDGKEDFNDRLSANRGKSAEKALKKITKKVDVKDIAKNTQSVGEDWDGFKEFVAGSNIEDKELILRVLSMYSDPAVREKEIRNMSSVYGELAKDILPQLRRARFVANIEYRNYSDEELQELVKNDINSLDETALLKAATLCKDHAKTIYKKAEHKFSSAKAIFALACIALDEHDMDAAAGYIARCDANDADVLNLQGVIKMREGHITAAKELFSKAGTEDAKKNLGLCAIREGDYAKAISILGKKGPDAAIAHILTGDVDTAIECVKDCGCAKSEYIRAICFARKGMNTEAKAALEKAAACEKLAKRAETDIEFAKL